MIDQEEYLRAKADSLFKVWQQSYEENVLSKYKVVEVESEFQFPLMNPETRALSRTFVEAGKIDAVLEDKDGGIWLGEHKTASEDIGCGSNYWRRLAIDTQISKYLVALLTQYGDRVRGVIYDAVKKPMHRPSNVPVRDEKGNKITLDPFGMRVMNQNGSPRQSPDVEKGWVLQTQLETPGEYGARILTAMEEEPAAYIQIQEVGRSDSDISEYMEDAWAVSQQILYFRRKGIWPRNTDACAAWGTCEFFDLCTSRASVDGVRFGMKATAHAELSTVVSERELLTNSRLKSLRKCARLHYHKYEEPKEKIGDESEALWFGSLWHDKIENFLKTKIQNQ